MSVILHALLVHFLSRRPEDVIRAQEVCDKLPEVEAVFATVDCALSPFPSGDRVPLSEKVLLIAVEGHDGTQGPHIDWLRILLLLKHKLAS